MQQLFNGKYYEADETGRASAKIHTLLKEVQLELDCKNDSQLALKLGLNKPDISKLRNRKNPLSYHKMIRISEATGWSIYKIREILGV